MVLLVVGSFIMDRIVRLWNPIGKHLATLKGHNSAVVSVAWSPNGKTLASASADNTVRLWQINY
jgi:WD40 repeat protein